MKVLFCFVLLLRSAASFTLVGHPVSTSVGGRVGTRLYETEEPVTEDDEIVKNAKVDTFLEKKFPSFFKLMNDEMRKALREDKATIFAPNEAAFEALGEKKLTQLKDPRNAEICEKMGSYHIIPGAAISAIELRTEDWTKGRPKDGSKPNTLIAAVVTQSGEVPVGREKSGGVLGWGAKEVGDFVIGPGAKIVKSFNVDECVIHETDALVSPLALWRYCDQLRIPGF